MFYVRCIYLLWLILFTIKYKCDAVHFLQHVLLQINTEYFSSEHVDAYEGTRKLHTPNELSTVNEHGNTNQLVMQDSSLASRVMSAHTFE